MNITDPLYKNQEEYFQNMGTFLGYPQCCIDSFQERVRQLLPVPKEQAEASKLNGEYTGFIPCEEHSKQILKGEITLESLIKNRMCKTDFPDESGIIVNFK